MHLPTRRLKIRARKTLVRALLTWPAGRLLDPSSEHRPLRRVVVVTGMHRSGTTIMGRLLSLAPRSFSLHEPFNLDWGLVGVEQRYPYLTAADVESPSTRTLRRFLTTGDGTWKGYGEPIPPTHKRAAAALYNVRVLRPLGHTIIVKDPFLLLALGWINHGLSDRPVVVTLRHPCAWVMSLLRRSMHPRSAIRAFLEQDGFGDPVVKEILGKADWERAGLVESGAATWSILVRMLEVQLDAGADARVIRMEDFAEDPRGTLVDLYDGCGLRQPADLDRIVAEYTGTQNVVVPEGRVLHKLQRNSSALATAWRTGLPADDQATIRDIAGPYAGRWYEPW